MRFNHTIHIKFEVVPRLCVGDHIPSNGIGPIFGHGFERIDGVAEAFAHLVAVFIENESVGDHVFEGHFIEQQGADGVEGKEPAAGLVYAFCDEICGEVLFENVLIFEGIVPLGIGHRPAIEPHIDEVEFARHGFAGGAHQGNAIHVGAVQILGEVFCRLVEAEDLVGFFDFLVEFIDAADADFFAAVFGAPDGQGSSPESGAGEVPIYKVFEPVAESAFAGGSGFPVDGFIEFYQAIFHGCGAHEPALEGVVEDGFIGTPAVGVGVLVFFYLEGFVFLFEFDGDAFIHAKVFVATLFLCFFGFFIIG